ncbi:hypothetical protein GCM10027612_14790 [Microbispora bryophytorum subsp. camponoti]
MSIATGAANEAGTPPGDVSWQVVAARGQLTTVDPAEASGTDPARTSTARMGGSRRKNIRTPVAESLPSINRIPRRQFAA